MPIGKKIHLVFLSEAFIFKHQFLPVRITDNDQRAERLFADIVDQGARLPSQRRYAARARNLERGYVEIPQQLHEDILKLTIS